MNVLIWHVHGSWMTNFVQGSHTYLIPTVDDRGPDGRGRALTWMWPSNAVEVSPDELADLPLDVIVVQQQRDIELATRWLGGRVPGRDVPMIWLEHNAPQGAINDLRHPAADRDDLVVVHVTHTNAMFWDTGRTATTVIEHGIRDPGHLWTGDEPATGVVINEPVRRRRVVGLDLLEHFGAVTRVDVFGMDVEPLRKMFDEPDWLRVHDDVPQHQMHRLLAHRRCYLHPYRWTSLGLSLIEAMMLGMPVVALSTLEIPAAVPAGCGVVSNDMNALVRAVQRLGNDRELAATLGDAARAHALGHYGLERFLSEWDHLLEVMCP